MTETPRPAGEEPGVRPRRAATSSRSAFEHVEEDDRVDEAAAWVTANFREALDRLGRE